MCHESGKGFIASHKTLVPVRMFMSILRVEPSCCTLAGAGIAYSARASEGPLCRTNLFSAAHAKKWPSEAEPAIINPNEVIVWRMVTAAVLARLGCPEY